MRRRGRTLEGTRDRPPDGGAVGRRSRRPGIYTTLPVGRPLTWAPSPGAGPSLSLQGTSHLPV